MFELDYKQATAVFSEKSKTRPEITPWGILVHTTGAGIYAAASKANETPIEWVLDYYRQRGSCHYLVTRAGSCYQILPETVRGAHAGGSSIQAAERRRKLCLSGKWEKECHAKGVELWKARWPGYKSPQHLFPGKSPNDSYIGIELQAPEKPPKSGSWFTEEQMHRLADITIDISIRRKYPEGWHLSPRLAGHEDVDPLERWDARGGWDPGGLRDVFRFDWASLIAAIESK